MTPPNAAIQGSPDWQTVMRTEGFNLLSAYGDADLFFAVSTTADLANKPDGTPAFFLEFFSDRNDPSIDSSLYAMIHMEFEQQGDFAAAYNSLKNARSRAALMPMPLNSGTYCHLECGDTHHSAPFAWDALRASIHSRISILSARLLYAALDAGGNAIAKAAIECGLAAFLPRLESSVCFETSKLLASLAELSPAQSSVPFERMIRFLQSPPPELIQVEGGRQEEAVPLGLALAGRVRHYFGGFAACPRISDGPHIRLSLSPDASNEITRWDLRTPLMAEMPMFLNYDPFTVIVKGCDRNRVTGFTRVPALPDQLRTRTVTVASGMPPNIQGCAAVQVALRVEKDLSATGTPTVQYMTLYPSEARSADVNLKYQKINTKKPYSAQVIVVWADHITETPWFPCEDDYLFIDASRLPGTCLTIRALPGLLAEAVIEASLSAVAGQAPLTATLNESEPVITFLLESVIPEARLRVSARDPLTTENTASLDVPCRSTTLDRLSFHEYGPQTVNVTVHFDEGESATRLEFAAESGNESLTLEFSPADATGQFSYFSTSIFRNRYRFRRLEFGVTPGLWSPYQDPRQSLILDVGCYGARQRSNQHG